MSITDLLLNNRHILPNEVFNECLTTIENQFTAKSTHARSPKRTMQSQTSRSCFPRVSEGFLRNLETVLGLRASVGWYSALTASRDVFDENPAGSVFPPRKRLRLADNVDTTNGVVPFKGWGVRFKHFPIPKKLPDPGYTVFTGKDTFLWFLHLKQALDDRYKEEAPCNIFQAELNFAFEETTRKLHNGTMSWKDMIQTVYVLSHTDWEQPKVVTLLAKRILASGTMSYWTGRKTTKLLLGLAVMKEKWSPRNVKRFFGPRSEVHDLFYTTVQKFLERGGLIRCPNDGVVDFLFVLRKWGDRSVAKNEKYMRSISREVLRTKRIQRYTNGQLPSLIYSLGRLGFTDRDLYVALLAGVLDHIDECSEQHLSNVLLGLGHAGFKKEGMVQSLVHKIVEPQTLNSISNHGLCNILHGLSKMRYQDTVEINSILRVVRKRLSGMTSFQVSSIMNALGNFGIALDDLQDANFDQLVNHIAADAAQRCWQCNVEDLNDRWLCNIVCGLAKLGVNKKDIWNKTYRTIREDNRAGLYGIKELGTLCWGIGTSRFYQSKSLSVLLEQVSQLDEEKYRDELCFIMQQALFPCCQFLHYDHEFLSSVWGRVSRSRGLSDWDVLHFAWSLCLIGFLDKKKYELMLRMLTQAPYGNPKVVQSPKEKFEANFKFLVEYGRNYYEGPDYKSVFENLHGERRNTFRGIESHLLRNARHANSEFDMEVGEVLRELELPHTSNVRINDCAVVNYQLQGHSGCLVVLWDNKSTVYDMSADEWRMVGPLRKEVELLKTLGHKVVCIGIRQWRKRNRNDQQKLIQHMLMDVGCWNETVRGMDNHVSDSGV